MPDPDDSPLRPSLEEAFTRFTRAAGDACGPYNVAPKDLGKALARLREDVSAALAGFEEAGRGLDRARLPEVMTVAEVATALDRCKHWVRSQIAERRLRAARPGGRGGWLVRREWVLAYLDACSEEPSS